MQQDFLYTLYIKVAVGETGFAAKILPDSVRTQFPMIFCQKISKNNSHIFNEKKMLPTGRKIENVRSNL